MRFKRLERIFFMPNFADANKLQRRVKAAAQQSSNKFGSAFALHFTCTVNERKRGLASDL